MVLGTIIVAADKLSLATKKMTVAIEESTYSNHSVHGNKGPFYSNQPTDVAIT
jgi:hypothetical protein